ncbi:SsrA-binding protein [Candidatus Shapirobacteria bacterium]|nr:SsrA-binding protein [Candidatus Shapirobacteria bacterium]
MLIKNHKAYRDYLILDELEAGIALSGPEVKSLRAGQGTLDQSLINIKKGEAFLENAYIAPYQPAAGLNPPNPRQSRRLLLKKREILALHNKVKQQKLTPLALEWYNKGNLIKLKVGLGKKKKKGKEKRERREY